MLAQVSAVAALVAAAAVALVAAAAVALVAVVLVVVALRIIVGMWWLFCATRVSSTQ